MKDTTYALTALPLHFLYARSDTPSKRPPLARKPAAMNARYLMVPSGPKLLATFDNSSEACASLSDTPVHQWLSSVSHLGYLVFSVWLYLLAREPGGSWSVLGRRRPCLDSAWHISSAVRFEPRANGWLETEDMSAERWF